MIRCTMSGLLFLVAAFVLYAVAPSLPAKSGSGGEHVFGSVSSGEWDVFQDGFAADGVAVERDNAGIARRTAQIRLLAVAAAMIGVACIAAGALKTLRPGLGLVAPVADERSSASMDTTLFAWTADDPFTVRDLLNGGVAIFGRSGSGKTSSSGRLIGQAIVNYPLSGGLILAAKPGDAGMWQSIFEKAGRQDDLMIFSPESELRFDFLDYEMRHGGHTRNITRCIKTIGETLRSSDTKGAGEDGDFWEQQQERMLYCAVEVERLANGKVTAPNLQRFIAGAAQHPEQLATEEWQAGYHNQCMKAAYERQKSGIESHDFSLAADYWLGEFPAMADRTRSSILAGVMGILHVFNTGIVRELVSNGTNVTPDDMLQGRWVLVDMAPSEWSDMGNFVKAGWKYLTQRRILRRDAQPGECINVIFCDEYQQFINSMDAHYLAQCRSHLGCMVCLTQSLHSYHAALKGQAGKHQAEALLANFGLKIAHSLGDHESAEWFSNLLGRDLETFIGGSSQPDEELFSSIFGRGRYSGSFHESYEAVLQPRVFMSGLRCGGPSAGYVCDGYVVKSGEPFSSGQNWMRVEFSQRD